MNRASNRRRWWVALIGLALLIPLFSLLSMAARVEIGPTGTLPHLLLTVIPDVTFQSIVLCMGVSVLTSSMGVLSAWWTSTCEFRGRRLAEGLLLLPMAMPSYVIAYAYTDALQYSGPIQSTLRDLLGSGFRLPEIRSLPGAIFVLSVVLYPYVYLLARTAFTERSANLLDAARSLGCGPTRTFLQVALPVARPAVVAGLSLVLMETLAEYGALSYFGVQTYTTAIYRSWLNLGDRSSAAILAVLLLCFMLFLMSAEAKARGQARFYTMTGRTVRPRKRQLSALGGFVVGVLTIMPAVLGFIFPMVFLLRLLAGSDNPYELSRFVMWARNSVSLGLLAAACALLLAIGLGYARRMQAPRWVAAVHQAVSLGYGVPGAIIAIAILIPLAQVDRWSLDLFGRGVLPVLTGSVFALLYAYCVRFTSAALQSVDTGLQRITPHIDDSARVLGCQPRAIWWRVHMPMLRGSMATGALLVFVDVMKELPTTLVLRPFDFDTLAVMTYQLAADERLAEAALPALSIVMVSMVPMFLLIRQTMRAGR